MQAQRRRRDMVVRAIAARLQQVCLAAELGARQPPVQERLILGQCQEAHFEEAQHVRGNAAKVAVIVVIGS